MNPKAKELADKVSRLMDEVAGGWAAETDPSDAGEFSRAWNNLFKFKCFLMDSLDRGEHADA